ncbi:hypothetical protein EGM51_16305 [Verrucomicrobia bacterium S94]|nr:hypothetical protein EGM51_16305 [Verrucomicrobia bacterium S94]
MKILELRFKNINSLYGEWCIDFTDPDFAADGLFAITGATRSGKTTILDALCLALYGQTPRLGKMTQSDNEVMSRQTGDCFAEVLFEAASGTFRATWHQHRSRKKAGAALQAPRREVAKADGTLLAEKLKDVQEQIDSITGMSFDRFTRSILLAQGSFDTFLKADADERSPILEQITGTEIYSEISKAVHQRNSAENRVLSELKAGLGGIALLSEDELEQIGFDLKRLEEKHRTETKKRDAAKAALDWLARIETLEKDLETNRAEQKLWRIENEAFQPEAERLALAKRARPLDVEHLKLVNLRNLRSEIETDLKDANKALPELDKQYKEATDALNACTEQLEETTKAQRELAPVLKQVRALDTTIAERSASLEKEAEQIAELQNEQIALQSKETENRAKLAQRQTELLEAATYQETHPQDAALVGQLAAIFQSLEQLKALEADQTEARSEAEAADAAAKTAADTAKTAAEQLAAAQEQCAQAETALTAVNTDLETACAGQSFAEWQTRLNELQRRFKLEKQGTENRNALSAKTAEVQTITDELAQKINEQTGLQREQELLLQNLQLRREIESLEAQRSELIDGQPCPLCGALEHPYASKLPKPETDSIDKVNAALSTLAEQINTLTGKRAAAEAQSQTLRESIERDEAELQTLAAGTADEADEIAGRIERIKTLEQTLAEAKDAFDTARARLSEQRLAEQTAQQTAASAEEKREAAERRKTETAERFAKAESKLFQTLEPYGIESQETTAEQLKARRDRWVDSEKQSADLKQAIAHLETTLANQSEQLDNLKHRHRELTKRIHEQQSSLTQLITDRQTQFGDRQPDKVEHEHQTALDTARATHDAARQHQHQIEQTRTRVREKIRTLEENRQTNAAELAEQESLFFQTLDTAGFEDEAAYLAARLTESEQTELEKRADELKQRQIQLTALETEKVKQLQAERAQKHMETSPEEYAELSDSCIALQQEIGGLKDRIKANEQAQTRHAEKLAEIEKQQTECHRWNTLHELIGSADGKKFRNFAQGLTFELMVSHANRQLAKMSDRYLLIRDIEKPLDLNVVDNYQAGEIRPVKNLSGGESFIVSLSLALGLSKMASKQIRVDSLFLDEGFGTLDEDALETALEALAELKQDGKLIGVISHVGALKERIGTQINVHTTSGGRSRLSGTGVSSPS